MAKVKNKDFEMLLSIRAEEEKSKFVNLLFSSQLIEGLPVDEPDIYIKRIFLQKGWCVAYKLYDDKWYLVEGTELLCDNMWGLSDTITLIFKNGNEIRNLKIGEEAFIIRYTPNMKGLEYWLDEMCKRIARIDLAIENNLLYASMGFVYGCDGANIKSLKEALRQGAQGDFAIFTSNNIADNINTEKVQAQYYGDKFYDLKRKYIKEVLTRLIGVASAEEKKERTTSFDMNVNEATDTAYIYVDTFNNDAKKYDIPIRIKLNSTIEDLYKKYFDLDNNNESEGVE